MRPAVRIVLAPIRHRNRGLVTHGQALGRVIEIDPRTLNPARVLLHELIHIEKPGWSESRVRREESKRWGKLTWRQKAGLLKLLGRAVIEREEPES